MEMVKNILGKVDDNEDSDDDDNDPSLKFLEAEMNRMGIKDEIIKTKKRTSYMDATASSTRRSKKGGEIKQRLIKKKNAVNQARDNIIK